MRIRTKCKVMLFVLLALAGSAAQAQLPFTVSGTIASGPQYDLYTVTLPEAGAITGTLVCDFDGVSRPLDPVLSVYFPGNTGWDDTINADVYNDDGFGTDDDPLGVDCDAFDSSRVLFNAPVAGDYVFRADGFGSATGPYTLAIDFTRGLVFIPTLDSVGIALFAVLLVGASLLLLRRRQQKA